MQCGVDFRQRSEEMFVFAFAQCKGKFTLSKNKNFFWSLLQLSVHKHIKFPNKLSASDTSFTFACDKSKCTLKKAKKSLWR